MDYNILIIDDISNIDYLDSIKAIDGVVSQVELDTQTIIDKIMQEQVAMLILNADLISQKEFEHINGVTDIVGREIPILAIKNNTAFKSDIIYDFIDFKNDKDTAIRKIKFCQNLFNKEQVHHQNLEKMLFIDNLTQFPNRTKLIEDIKKDENNIKGIAIIDINDFKEINDFYGLRIGDNILKYTINLISNTISHLNNQVQLYKFSSDVYCIVNKKLSNNDFEMLVTIVLGSIETSIYREDEYEINIKATAGITFSNKKNKLITADLALQYAKQNRKDYMVFFDELDNVSEYQKNMDWTKKLKYAIDNDNIVVYYQPLVNNQTLNVDKYECLVRMIVDDKVISPFFFLEIAKKANQYKNLTKIVIDKAFKQFENLPFGFSLNVSYEDIEDKMFLHFIKDRLKKYDVASRVTWEILEDEGIKDYDVLLDFIKHVKELGCKVSIDDFGSGYSNFEHLLKMDVDYLKIDASLIKNVAIDENSYNVVKTVINFAKSLNIKTVSEYVENKEIYEITKELGSTYSQGYYFSAPLPKPDVYDYKSKG
jgi:diguanylate cyclase (GGDEF)-like protein